MWPFKKKAVPTATMTAQPHSDVESHLSMAMEENALLKQQVAKLERIIESDRGAFDLKIHEMSDQFVELKSVDRDRKHALERLKDIVTNVVDEHPQGASNKDPAPFQLKVAAMHTAGLTAQLADIKNLHPESSVFMKTKQKFQDGRHKSSIRLSYEKAFDECGHSLGVDDPSIYRLD